MKIKMQSWNWK